MVYLVGHETIDRTGLEVALVRRMIRRLLTGNIAVLLGIGALAWPAAPVAAGGPDKITVSNDDMPEPLIVRLGDDPELFAALYSEVDWLISRPGDAEEPEDKDLGPAYTVVVHVDGKAGHSFVLYPEAAGGPRAYRPRKQPDRKVGEAWFYGRLSMPDTLRDAGAPIGGAAPGGAGGGATRDAIASPAPGAIALLEEWREGMLLNGGVLLAILVGLAGVSLLIRRKV